MNEPEVRESFLRYTNPFGLVDNESALSGGNSGNSLLFHAHYVWTMVRRGYWLAGLDRAKTLINVDKCQVDNAMPGLFARAPHGIWPWEDQEGPDDYIGVISMSAADPQLPFAQDFLAYGRSGPGAPIRQPLENDGHPWLAKLFGWIRLHWVFNNCVPGLLVRWEGPREVSNWTAWLGRFPQIIAHAEFASRQRPPLWRRIWWAGSVWQAARFSDKDGTDQWILAWHLVAAFRASGQKSWLCEWASRNFMERLFTRWPGGLSSVFAVYFGMGHPLTKYFLS
jgi:hypothetical protein